MDFSGNAGAKFDPSKREDYMNEVKQQLAIANAQELLQVRVVTLSPDETISISLDRYTVFVIDRVFEYLQL
jgi:hypothetical protein